MSASLNPPSVENQPHGEQPFHPDQDSFNVLRTVTRVKKRIIVCCDGTWKDGISTEDRQSYTNILRLARIINHEDARLQPPIPQIVFYQSGIGSDDSLYSEYIDGVTGASLAEKVQEAYGFIAHNFCPGDEIFLFGFSRGAYTARLVATFIGEIGVLDRFQMDEFPRIFLSYQKVGKSNDNNEIQRLTAELAPWTHHDSPGKKRADSDADSFSVKFLGVYETVGSLGLPEELTRRSKQVKTVFGFNDRVLGEHIEYAYQALALNETRVDFDCCKFEQSPAALRKKQTLSQCWFIGSHADVGGGYRKHDLADLSLFWMAANMEKHLSLDYTYLGSLPRPTAPWGTQPPHDPATGIFKLASQAQRVLPTETNDVTHETIHSSVLQQAKPYASLGIDLVEHPNLVAPLLPLEDALHRHWPSLIVTPSEPDPNSPPAADKELKHASSLATEPRGHANWIAKFTHEIKSAVLH
ncbi:hypothetical protein C8J57DRAFT_1269293 [Mycena rebaudengoi]|nr:hypothetical protein C8J57DRAFT_1269293 [Mycena rebaudengoi]